MLVHRPLLVLQQPHILVRRPHNVDGLEVVGAPYSVKRAIRYAAHLETMRAHDAFDIVDDTMFFRGTLSWRELLTEVRLGRVEWDSGGRLHRGFADLYRPIRSHVLEATREHDVTYMCGHSLGGVFAVLAAHDMLLHTATRPRAVYTFGSPRMGDSDFVRTMQKRLPIYRLVNDEDLVTRVPPRCRHVGTRISLHFDHGSVLANHAIDKYGGALHARRSNATLFWMDAV